ncbi:hypothetical protein RRG08_050575 [Elysia crispata]|uniref:Uncharacterized protein n=1 Tax=Elysia crispata TaxID=231223 RepID=A0AAE0Z6Y5_9GAST|nr:hypothetical protein RRG08_050575 [Elysia crispata]
MREERRLSDGEKLAAVQSSVITIETIQPATERSTTREDTSQRPHVKPGLEKSIVRRESYRNGLEILEMERSEKWRLWRMWFIKTTKVKTSETERRKTTNLALQLVSSVHAWSRVTWGCNTSNDSRAVNWPVGTDMGH